MDREHSDRTWITTPLQLQRRILEILLQSGSSYQELQTVLETRYRLSRALSRPKALRCALEALVSRKKVICSLLGGEAVYQHPSVIRWTRRMSFGLMPIHRKKPGRKHPGESYTLIFSADGERIIYSNAYLNRLDPYEKRPIVIYRRS